MRTLFPFVFSLIIMISDYTLDPAKPSEDRKMMNKVEAKQQKILKDLDTMARKKEMEAEEIEKLYKRVKGLITEEIVNISVDI